MSSRNDDCDYIYKGISQLLFNQILNAKFEIVALSGDMGVGKSNILQR